jgi:TATA-box binding protein (TBP) (component of TFIID and TFIIIB)
MLYFPERILITPNFFAVLDQYKYFPDNPVSMKEKELALVAIILVCCTVAATGCMGLAENIVPGKAQPAMDYTAERDWQGVSVEKASGAAYPVPAPSSAPLQSGNAANVPGAGIETKIIKTAQATIEVRDVVASVDTLKALAVQKGGYLSSSSVQKNYNNQLYATVVLRVPQSEFESVMEGVKAVGTVKSVSTKGEDVTEEYVDLAARRIANQNQLTAYNRIMEKSEKVEDILKVQQQIERVQVELDRIEGRMRYLNSRIDLSTITVNLQEPEPVGGETGHSFISAINEGIAGFLGMIDAIIILLLTLLPLIVIGAAAYGIYRWKKSKKAVTSPPAGEEKKS